MVKVNENYLKLQGSYLFSTIGKKVAAFIAANPEKKVIRLGIGDVTQPLAPAIISALHGAVDEMADAATFKGYAPDLGYEFLRSAIAENDYKALGCDIAADEIFISEDIGYEKPSVSFFIPVEKKLNEYGIKKDECLIVGDSESSDMALARNVGIKGVHYTNGLSNSDCVISDLSTVLTMLQ